MSLKDDLLRNRRVFELLTASEAVGPDSVPTRIKSTPASDLYDLETQESARQGFRPQEDAAQKSETFSLGFGSRVSRETGMALSLLPLEGVVFPELKKAAAQTPTDPLESLYHQLEAEARRTSQLLGEEEY